MVGPRRPRGERGSFGGAADRDVDPMIVAAKSALRREIRSRRESLPAEERESESAVIAGAVIGHAAVDAATTVHTFIGALAGEVETRGLVESLLAAGRVVVCPRVAAAAGEMEHRRIASLEDLAKSGLGLWEPRSRCERVELDEIDVVLVPGVAFDRTGGRLGMGGGYYDRMLSGWEGTSIGLCFDAQLVDAVPRATWDAGVDWVITGSEAIDCRGQG